MQDYNTLFVASAFLVPLVIGLVQIVKSAGLPSTWAGAVAVGLGIGTQFLATTLIASPHWGVTVLLGIGVGLSAAGLYSTVKKINE